MKKYPSLPVLLLSAATIFSPMKGNAAILIQSGQKIGFLGDSITEQGAAPSGYINLVIMGLKVEGVDAIAIPAGVSGNTSGNMKARLGPNVLDKGADWMTLSCGVNDVRMQQEGRGGDVEKFKENVTAIVEQALAKKLQIVLLTTTPLGEELGSDRNKLVAPYNDFLRSYAKDKNLVLADVNTAFADALKVPPTADFSGDVTKRLLADGTHPNQDGQMLMAKTVLLAVGVPPADMPKIQKEWLENPKGKGVKLEGRVFALISQNQYNALEKTAKEQHKTVRTIVEELWKKTVADYNTQEGAKADPAKANEAAQAKIGAMVDDFLKNGKSNP